MAVADELAAAFTDFEAMQERHHHLVEEGIASLAGGHGAPPAAGLWHWEREKSRQRLAAALDALWQLPADDPARRELLSAQCADRLARLLSEDRLLAARIGQARELVGQELGRLTQGRKALAGYGRTVRR
ncbi:MAG: hypothetical protein AB1634_14710 [Thermodesulfobacteriota bacterium]